MTQQHLWQGNRQDIDSTYGVLYSIFIINGCVLSVGLIRDEQTFSITKDQKEGTLWKQAIQDRLDWTGLACANTHAHS